MPIFGRKKTEEAPWRFVGTVEAACVEKQEDGTEVACHGYINLYESGDRQRRYEVIGDLQRHSSPASRFAHAQVRGWEAGGPVPPLAWPEDGDEEHQATLFVFPGGKDGAA